MAHGIKCIHEVYKYHEGFETEFLSGLKGGYEGVNGISATFLLGQPPWASRKLSRIYGIIQLIIM